MSRPNSTFKKYGSVWAAVVNENKKYIKVPWPGNVNPSDCKPTWKRHLVLVVERDEGRGLRCAVSTFKNQWQSACTIIAKSIPEAKKEISKI